MCGCCNYTGEFRTFRTTNPLTKCRIYSWNAEWNGGNVGCSIDSSFFFLLRTLALGRLFYTRGSLHNTIDRSTAQETEVNFIPTNIHWRRENTIPICYWDDGVPHATAKNRLCWATDSRMLVNRKYWEGCERSTNAVQVLNVGHRFVKLSNWTLRAVCPNYNGINGKEAIYRLIDELHVKV